MRSVGKRSRRLWVIARVLTSVLSSTLIYILNNVARKLRFLYPVMQITTRFKRHEPRGAIGSFLDLEAGVDRDEEVDTDGEDTDTQGTLS